MEEFLKIKDFNLKKTKVDLQELKKFQSQEQYVSIAVELLKEAARITTLLAFTHPLDNLNKPRKWTRNEAILSGLMVRLTKLQLGIIDATDKQRMEIAHLLFRCLAETVINLRYLLIKGKESEDIYEKYVQYSLQEEQRLLDVIDGNVQARGEEIPIEKQMRKSILQSFEDSGLAPSNAKRTKQKGWEGTVFDRADAIGMKDAYLGIFGLPSHVVHGNWQDLLMYHIDRDGQEFSPRGGWAAPQPEIVLAAALLSCNVCEEYLHILLPQSDDRNMVSGMLKDLLVRVHVVIEMAQQFSERHQVIPRADKK